MDMGGGMSYGLGMQGVEGLTPLSGGMGASAGAPMQAKKPKDMGEAEHMMHEYGEKRSKNRNLDNMSHEEIKNLKHSEDAALLKHAQGMKIPADVRETIDEKARRMKDHSTFGGSEEHARKFYTDAYHQSLASNGTDDRLRSRYDEIMLEEAIAGMSGNMDDIEDELLDEQV